MSKCSFSLNPKIKGYIEWQIEHYHEDKRQIEEYKKDLMPSATASYSLTAGCSKGEVGNSTEKTAIKIMSNTYILSTERSIKAIDSVLCQCDDADKLLIDLVYWRRTYTVEGAGVCIGLSRRAAYYRINKLLCAVAAEMGLITA